MLTSHRRSFLVRILDTPKSDPSAIQLREGTDTTRSATALITAESIIVGFLVAYAPVFNQTIRSLDKEGLPLFTTVLAGLLVYALALTAFRSIHLLFKSISAKDPDHGNYLAGYELFLMVIVGSSAYVLMNAVSIVHYGLVHDVVPFANESLSIIIAGIFFAGWILLVIIKAPELTECVHRTRNKVGNWHFGLLPGLLICDIAEVEVLILQPSLLKKWWSWLLPIAFAVATIVEIGIWIWKYRKTK